MISSIISLITSKMGIGGIIFLFVLGGGYFGWNYIDGINQDKLDLALKNQDLDGRLKAETAKSDDMLSTVNDYAKLSLDTSTELNRVKKEHAILEGKFNAVQFAKHFERWAKDDPNRLADCMQSSFNRLLDNLQAANRNQIPAHQDPLSCAPSDGHADSEAVITLSGR